MANLPEKNITTVDKVTSIPSNANLYINANGEFRQATVDDVLKASPVIADSITDQFKNASGSPILLTDSAKGVAIDFKAKGKSTQDGEPTPTEPITPKSNGDMGYFDGELLQGAYSSSNGEITTNATYLCSKNFIPCNVGDEITLKYATSMRVVNLLYYDESKTFITSSTAQTNVDKHTATAPTNAKYFKFNISESSTVITVSDAKHICVTINDKYALIVDSVGKNLLNNTATTQTINGVTFTVNEDKSVTVNGTATANAELVIGSFNAEVDSYILNGCPNGAVNYGIRLYDRVIHKASDIGNSVAYEVTTKTTLKSSIFIGSEVTVNNLTFYPMIRKAEITDATYEPYIHSRKYIPISAPLRGIGEVTDVARLTEGKVDRKFAEVVFDGSDDERWLLNMNVGFTNVFYSELLNFRANNLDRNKVICGHYIVKVMAIPMDYDYIMSIGTYINVRDIRFTTVDEFKAWLQSNPITVIYELAESTTESIEPIDVDTFEGVTHISVSDNADMEVEYPTSKVAGIASIGWSKGRRAEYDLEQLKAQMLALQTTIVSTV